MKRRRVRRFACILLIALGLALVLAAAKHAEQRWRKPRFLHEFETLEEVDGLTWKCKTLLAIVPSPASRGGHALQMVLHPASEGVDNFPGVSFGDFDGNWSRHRMLRLEVHNPQSDVVPLTLRIDDRQAPDYGERYNRTFALAPGPNVLALPLGNLVTSGSRRPLSLGRIEAVSVFVANPDGRIVLHLERILVE